MLFKVTNFIFPMLNLTDKNIGQVATNFDINDAEFKKLNDEAKKLNKEIDVLRAKQANIIKETLSPIFHKRTKK